MSPLRNVPGESWIRTVDLADLLLDVRDQLGLVKIDAYLFGSRRYKTGSVRSDIDVLLFFEGRIADSDAQAIWNKEPYLDIFCASSGSAQSIVNESMITRDDRRSLIDALDAVPLYIAGVWQESSDEFRLQSVLAERNPMATNANLYELSMSLPGERADILAITALPEEYRAATAELGIILRSERSRVEIKPITGGSPWLVELVLISSMGSVQAALETNDSLRRTKAAHVVLLGIAAGIPGEINVGDVMLPEQICYYESLKVTDDGELGAPIWKSTNADVRRAASVFPMIAETGGWAVAVNTQSILASGEKVVASEEFREKVRRAHRNLAAIDMESYGVACAAERRRSSLTVIKGISDFADSSKNDDSHSLAARNSARVFRFLVRNQAFRAPSDRD